jgi:hypothetical protein
MDVVWMDKFFSYKILKNKKGQSTVEYILLLAVLVSLSAVVLKNKKIKSLMAGKEGLFADMKKGMAYSYRYGRDLDANVDYDQAMSFEYSNNKHDTYFNETKGISRFFVGAEIYPK